MNETNNPPKFKAFTTVDGEEVPVTIGESIKSVQDFGESPLTPFVSCLSAIPPEITLTMRQIGITWIRLKSFLSRVIDDMLIALAGQFRPKWLYYYRHGRSGKTRRKYRKMLIRLFWKGLAHG